MAKTNALEILSALTGKSIKTLIDEALKQNHGVVTHAAKSLGISRQALYKRMEKCASPALAEPQR